LFEFPKLALNFSTKFSKSFKNGNWCSNKGANHIKVVVNDNVLMNQLGLSHLDNDGDEVK
jgi:hypothetical protein